MAEVDRLDLRELPEGTAFQVAAEVSGNHSSDARSKFQYDIAVVQSGETPLCDMTKTDPSGKRMGPLQVLLEGSHRIVTERECPTLRGDPLFGKPHRDQAPQILHGELLVGCDLVITIPLDPTDNYWLLEKITSINT